ncbi:MAG: dicarboxylate/amino acid:cation symporter [Gemmatimonadetes bacterium]|nr:dicarboxylate/amino acid:cation symporter [Gemmatimonadota bacterium]
MSLTARVLAALLAGLAAGVAIAWSKSPALLSVVSAVEPIGALWVNAIRMTVVPLVVSLLFTGIASSSGHNIGRMGGRAVAWFVGLVAAGALFTAIVAPPLLSLADLDSAAFASLREGTSTAAVELPPFRDWIVNLIPSNPVRAAADGAMLPLIVFTAIFALAATRLESAHRDMLVDAFTAVARAMLVIVEWILLVAPVGVFFLVLSFAARTGAELVAALGSFVLVACGLIVIASAALYPIATVFGGIPLRQFARACAPAQAVAFSTRSSLASLPAMLDSAERELKLPPQVSGMALPIAVALFKFASPIARMTGTFFVAQLYGIDLGVVQIAAIAGAIAALSFYSPGIPSGGLFILTPIYVALNLPIEGVGLLIALDLIPDMFITTGNVTADMAVVAVIGRSKTIR